MSVKPLLLYYGVLSLSRGAILLQDHSKKEESLKKSHGLRDFKWQETLKDGIKNVLELQVKATNGTFGELVVACSNRHIEHCFYIPTNTRAVVDHDLGDISFADGGSPLTLDDLLSRLMATTFAYPEITGRDPQFFPVVVAQGATQTHFALLSSNVIPDLQGLVDGASVLIQPTPTGWPYLPIPTIPQQSLVFQHEANKAHQKKFPVFHHTDGASAMTGVLNFPSGDKLSEFFKLYLVSYILGMLARYYPSQWMALMHYSPGDFASPLLLSAVEAIESKFPAELSAQVRQHPQTFG